MRSKGASRRLGALAAALLLAACNPAPPPASVPSSATLPSAAPSASDSPPTLPPDFAGRLTEAGLVGRALDDAGNAWAIAEVASDSGSFLVQWADLRKVAVEQVVGATEGGGPPSFYHPAAPSPAFALLDPANVVRQSWDRGALSVMNGAFFETPGQPSSQIAFPVAAGGAVVTGGSSPYGPGRPSARGTRWAQPLRVLVLDTLARVAEYDRGTGAPLTEPGFREAIVSYAPDAHPSRIATRFHVLGALDADGDGSTEVLIVVTSDGQTRIEAAASLLTRLGVADDAQIALDGGASVLVWTPRGGTLHQPTPISGRPQPLPHYLVFRSR